MRWTSSHRPLTVGAALVVLVLCAAAPAAAVQTITFPSADGLVITADLYLQHKAPTTPFIVLFHQAGWSRGEYLEIAPKLGALGFNCMAVDLRSGGAVNGVDNATATIAATAGKGTTYIDALPDMIAALEYARKNHAPGKLIAWGSSYSAALVLKIAGDHPQLVDGVLSFAPGEYFAKLGKSKTWIHESTKKITAPVFITSAKNEAKQWVALFAAVPGRQKVSYVPDTAGNHGSRALWKKFGDSDGYWRAVEGFLRRSFLPAK